MIIGVTIFHIHMTLLASYYSTLLKYRYQEYSSGLSSSSNDAFGAVSISLLSDGAIQLASLLGAITLICTFKTKQREGSNRPRNPYWRPQRGGNHGSNYRSSCEGLEKTLVRHYGLEVFYYEKISESFACEIVYNNKKHYMNALFYELVSVVFFIYTLGTGSQPLDQTQRRILYLSLVHALILTHSVAQQLKVMPGSMCNLVPQVSLHEMYGPHPALWFVPIIHAAKPDRELFAEFSCGLRDVKTKN